MRQFVSGRFKYRSLCRRLNTDAFSHWHACRNKLQQPGAAAAAAGVSFIVTASPVAHLLVCAREQARNVNDAFTRVIELSGQLSSRDRRKSSVVLPSRRLSVRAGRLT